MLLGYLPFLTVALRDLVKHPPEKLKMQRLAHVGSFCFLNIPFQQVTIVAGLKT